MMSNALKEIVSSSNAIGEGVSSLVSSIIGAFQATSAAKSPTKPAATGNAAPATGAAKPSIALPTEPIPDFDIQGIGVVTQGATQLTDAQAAFKAGTDELVQAYHQLYRHKSTLAMAVLINVQVGNLETSLRETATAAKAVTEVWADLENGITQMIRNFDADEDSNVLVTTAAQLSADVDQSWKRLTATTKTISAAFLEHI